MGCGASKEPQIVYTKVAARQRYHRHDTGRYGYSNRPSAAPTPDADDSGDVNLSKDRSPQNDRDARGSTGYNSSSRRPSDPANRRKSNGPARRGSSTPPYSDAAAAAEKAANAAAAAASADTATANSNGQRTLGAAKRPSPATDSAPKQQGSADAGKNTEAFGYGVKASYGAGDSAAEAKADYAAAAATSHDDSQPSETTGRRYRQKRAAGGNANNTIDEVNKDTAKAFLSQPDPLRPSQPQSTPQAEQRTFGRSAPSEAFHSGTHNASSGGGAAAHTTGTGFMMDTGDDDDGADGVFAFPMANTSTGDAALDEVLRSIGRGQQPVAQRKSSIDFTVDDKRQGALPGIAVERVPQRLTLGELVAANAARDGRQRIDPALYRRGSYPIAKLEHPNKGPYTTVMPRVVPAGAGAKEYDGRTTTKRDKRRKSTGGEILEKKSFTKPDGMTKKSTRVDCDHIDDDDGYTLLVRPNAQTFFDEL